MSKHIISEKFLSIEAVENILKNKAQLMLLGAGSILALYGLYKLFERRERNPRNIN